MKLIILSAGQGTRLKPLTDHKPKCMVKYKGKTIIDYILDTAAQCKINNIVIIDGYKKEILEEHLKEKNINFYYNNNFQSTNMLYTLFCAEKEMDCDIIISYADIIYKKEILHSLIECKEDFAVVVDKAWENLWRLRMDNPLDDAETMKIDFNNNIKELGKKAKTIEEINGQYIGLIKISKNVINKIKKFYNELDKTALYDGKNFNNMYMTSFIQLVIDRLMDVKPVFISGGWLEIDSLEDLQCYEKNNFIIP